ncbi:TetR/AcrR family transcriptional regulator [bacterium]|nr:TetR/AcrR family transcriptional regulator [bacterium]
MSKKPVKKDNQKFQEILNAGAKIFYKKGYHNANISDIANEVGMLKGSLYYYIKSKEELLSYVIGPSIDIYVRILEEILDSGEKTELMFEQAIIAHMDPMDINFEKQAVFNNELANLPETLRGEVLAGVQKYKQLWRQLIEKGISEKIFRSDIDPKILLLALLGMTNWTTRWLKPGEKYTAKEIGKMYASIALDGIRIKSPPALQY